MSSNIWPNLSDKIQHKVVNTGCALVFYVSIQVAVKLGVEDVDIFDRVRAGMGVSLDISVHETRF